MEPLVSDKPRPMFFRQQRVGKFGRPFDILKFRTMIADAYAQIISTFVVRRARAIASRMIGR